MKINSIIFRCFIFVGIALLFVSCNRSSLPKNSENHVLIGSKWQITEKRGAHTYVTRYHFVSEKDVKLLNVYHYGKEKEEEFEVETCNYRRKDTGSSDKILLFIHYPIENITEECTVDWNAKTMTIKRSSEETDPVFFLME